MTRVDDREIPAWQCTSTIPPHQTKPISNLDNWTPRWTPMDAATSGLRQQRRTWLNEPLWRNRSWLMVRSELIAPPTRQRALPQTQFERYICCIRISL
jgi:hypothetical protein